MTAAVATAGARRVPRLRRQAFEMTAATAVQRGTGAIGGIVAAHLLGPAGRGEYALYILFGSAIGLVLAGGLQFWVPTRLGVDASASDVRAVLARQARVVALAAAVTLGVASLLPHPVRATVAVLLALALGNGASTVLLAVPVGLRRTSIAALSLGAGGACWIGWLGLAVGLHWHAPEAIALGAAVSQAAVTAVCAWVLVAHVPRPTAAVAAAEHHRVLRAHLAPGLGEIVLLAAFRIDIAMVALLAGPRSAGLYAVATSVAEVLWLLPDAVANVLLPQVAAHANTNLRLVRAAALAACVAVAVPVVVFRVPLVVGVFGEPYRGATVALPWLVLAVLLLGSWKIDSAALMARGRGGVRLQSATLGLVVLVVGDLLLIPPFGIRGAAWACLAGYGTAAAIASRCAHRGAGAAAKVG